MAIDLTLKSVAVTNLEASPQVPIAPGAGGPQRLHHAGSYLLSVTAALTALSVIRLCRIPANAVVTSVRITSGAQAAGKFNIGVYRTPADGGLIAFTASDSFFTTDLDCAAAVIDQECVMKATSGNTPAKRAQPLWQAVGMAANPGGFFDICATVHTTDVTTGTGALRADVQYVV
jgi:hypothetical protein